ncbi:MAG: nucleotidyltransferase domain-containing protein [Alphaproteobacteria bacterium]|nr:nucleotidyltransferase domain-containing protein [Alphaproteobacteria bacterium]
MHKSIDMTPDQAKIVKKILKTILSPESKVWVFGSRAKGKTKPFSDLDLAIDCEQKPLSIETMADLREAFDESELPYKVDIVDINATTPEFLEMINTDKIVFDF